MRPCDHRVSILPSHSVKRPLLTATLPIKSWTNIPLIPRMSAGVDVSHTSPKGFTRKLMIESKNPVLTKMLDRLFASMVNGPSMNCRPQASRQRVDFFQLSRLRDLAAGPTVLQLLGEQAAV